MLVQVWAVGVDGVDGKLVGVTLGSSCATNTEEDLEEEDGQEEQVTPPRSGLGRSASLRSRLSISRSKRDVQRSASVKASASPVPFAPVQADVGYIPGRSFVGRVLECGWEVREQVVRKGEWVVGLLDVRKVSSHRGVLFFVQPAFGILIELRVVDFTYKFHFFASSLSYIQSELTFSI